MSIAFNGTSSKLSIADKLISGFPCSMFCWIKPTGLGSSPFCMGSGDFASATHELAHYVDASGSGKLRGWVNAAGAAAPSSTTSIATTWQPALIVYTSATSVSVYYAGGAVTTNDPGVGSPNFAAMTRFALGVRPGSDSSWFAGDIAEAALWSSALTQGNFDSLAGGALPESVAAGTLIDVWGLEDTGDLTGLVNSNVLTAANVSNGATHPIDTTGRGGGGGSSTVPIFTQHRRRR